MKPLKTSKKRRKYIYHMCPATETRRRLVSDGATTDNFGTEIDIYFCKKCKENYYS